MLSSCQVTDLDIGTNGMVEFTLDTSAVGIFTLRSTGSLSVGLYLNHFVDREITSEYSFTLFAIDRGVPPQVGHTDIIITVMVSIVV